jgi:hypothetical protein
LGGLKYNANYSNDAGIENSIINNIEKYWKEIKEITNQQLRFFSNSNRGVIVLTIDLENKVNGLYIGSNNKNLFLNTMDIIDIKWDYRSYEEDK